MILLFEQIGLYNFIDFNQFLFFVYAALENNKYYFLCVQSACGFQNIFVCINNMLVDSKLNKFSIYINFK